MKQTKRQKERKIGTKKPQGKQEKKLTKWQSTPLSIITLNTNRLNQKTE